MNIYPCFVPDLKEEGFQFFTLKYDANHKYFVNAHYGRRLPSIPSLLSNSHQDGVLNIVKCFLLFI